MRADRVVFACAVAFTPIAALGCGAEVQSTTPVDYANVTYAPAPVADYTTYPYTWYDDRPVYLIHERWWYREGDGRWAFYRTEPPHLARTRQSIEHPTPVVRPAEPHTSDVRVEEMPPPSAPIERR